MQHIEELKKGYHILEGSVNEFEYNKCKDEKCCLLLRKRQHEQNAWRVVRQQSAKKQDVNFVNVYLVASDLGLGNIVWKTC